MSGAAASHRNARGTVVTRAPTEEQFPSRIYESVLEHFHGVPEPLTPKATNRPRRSRSAVIVAPSGPEKWLDRHCWIQHRLR